MLHEHDNIEMKMTSGRGKFLKNTHDVCMTRVSDMTQAAP